MKLWNTLLCEEVEGSRHQDGGFGTGLFNVWNPTSNSFQVLVIKVMFSIKVFCEQQRKFCKNQVKIFWRSCDICGMYSAFTVCSALKGRWTIEKSKVKPSLNIQPLSGDRLDGHFSEMWHTRLLSKMGKYRKWLSPLFPTWEYIIEKKSTSPWIPQHAYATRQFLSSRKSSTVHLPRVALIWSSQSMPFVN